MITYLISIVTVLIVASLLLLSWFIMWLLYRQNKANLIAIRKKNLEIKETTEIFELSIARQKKESTEKLQALSKVTLISVTEIGKILASIQNAELAYAKFQWLSDYLLAESNKIIHSRDETMLISELADRSLKESVSKLCDIHNIHHIQIIPLFKLPDTFKLAYNQQVELLFFLNTLIHQAHTHSLVTKINMSFNIDNEDLLIINFSDIIPEISLQELAKKICYSASAFVTEKGISIYIPLFYDHSSVEKTL